MEVQWRKKRYETKIQALQPGGDQPTQAATAQIRPAEADQIRP